MDRNFEISPKHSHEWLAKQKWSFYDPKAQVAEAITLNAMELEASVDWNAILKCVGWTHIGKRYTGKAALTFSIAATIGSAAVHMGWDIHSPEVVYMSGYHFVWVLGKTIETSTQRPGLKGLEELERLKGFERQLSESLSGYASQYLPRSDEYLATLRYLIYLPSKESKKRSDIYKGLALAGSGSQI